MGGLAEAAGVLDDSAAAGGGASSGNGFLNQYILGKFLFKWIEHNPLTAAAISIPGLYQHGFEVPLINQDVPGPLAAQSFGQITGQGMGSGYSSMLNAFKISANPFDTITNDIANEIQKSAAEQGFSGHQQNDVANASADLVKGLGIDYKTAVELVTENVKNGTLSLKDFGTVMKSFKTTAHDTGVTLQTTIENMNTYSQAVISAGGKGLQSKAFALSSNLQESLEAVSKSGGMTALISGLASPEIQKLMVSMSGSGVSPALFASSQGQSAIPLGIQTFINQYANAKPENMTLTEWASVLQTENPVFQKLGINNTQIVDLLGKANRGEGFVNKFNKANRKREAILKKPPSQSISTQISHFFGSNAFAKDSLLDTIVSNYDDIKAGRVFGATPAEAKSYEKELVTDKGPFGTAARGVESVEEARIKDLYALMSAAQYSKSKIAKTLAPLYKEIKGPKTLVERARDYESTFRARSDHIEKIIHAIDLKVPNTTRQEQGVVEVKSTLDLTDEAKRLVKVTKTQTVTKNQKAEARARGKNTTKTGSPNS